MSRPVIPFAAGFALACALGSLWLSPSLSFFIALLCALLCAGVFIFKRKRLRVYAVVLAGLSAGLGCMLCAELFIISFADSLDGKSGTYTATAAEFSTVTDNGYGSIQVLLDPSPDDPFHRKVRTTIYYPAGLSIRPGDRLSFECELSRPDRSNGVDYDRIYRSYGIYLTGYSKVAPAIKNSPGPTFATFPKYLSKDIRERVASLFPGDLGVILSGMMLGGSGDTYDDFSSSVKATGTSHIFAVSGMNLAFIAALVMLIVFSRRAVFVLIPVCVLFGAMTGFSPSVLRAMLMLILPLLAPFFRRETDPLNTLFFALVLVLLSNPYLIVNPSFLLSFAAILGIFLYTKRLYVFFASPLERLPKKKFLAPVRFLYKFACGMFSSYLGATVFTLPITVLFFRTISLTAPLVNLLVLWSIPFLFIGGFVLAGIAFIIPAAAPFGAALLQPLLALIRQIIVFFGSSSFSAAGMDDSYLLFWFIFAYGALLVCLILKPNRPNFTWAITAAGCLVLCVFLSGWSAFHSLSVVFLPVGNGQCALLRNCGITIMLDCGGKNAAELAGDYLKQHNIKAVDYLILSHADTDHVNGVAELMDTVSVSHLLLNAEAAVREEGMISVDAAKDAGCAVTILTKDSRLDFGSTSLLLLMPGPSSAQMCITALASYGEKNIFFSADISDEDEDWLIDRGVLPELDILVSAHHGSKYGSSEAFLNAYSPMYAIISVGKNSYGQPDASTIQRLRSVGAKIYTTLDNGALNIKIHSNRIVLSHG